MTKVECTKSDFIDINVLDFQPSVLTLISLRLMIHKVIVSLFMINDET